MSDWRKEIIRVFRPTSGNRGKVATGFPVAPGIVMTACHALEHNGTIAETVLVRWFKAHADAGEPRQARVAWVSGPELDVALLAVDFPQAALVPCRLSDQPVRSGTRWEGEGFAEVLDSREGTRRPTSLMGETFGSSEPRFDVDNRGPPADEEDWPGVSGAPVLLEGTNLIIGMILQCPGELVGRLSAVSARAMLAERGFASFVRPHLEELERRERFDRRRREAELKLGQRSSPPFCALERMVPSAVRGNAGTGLELVSALCELDMPTLSRVLREAHQYLLEEGDRASALTVREVAYLIIPVVLDSVDVGAIDSSCGDPEAVAVSLRVSNHVVAEFAMARRDGRAAKFRHPPRAEAPRHWGAWHLPPGPDVGAFDHPERYVDELRRALRSEFNIDPAWVRDFVDGGGDPDEFLRLRLHTEMREGRTRYNIINVAASDYEKGGWPRIVGEMKRAFPELVFIRFDRDPALAYRDEEVFGTLVDRLSEGMD